MNETDGKGRKGGNIVRVRAFFVDADKDAKATLIAIKANSPKPSIVVRTSKRGFHAYWVVDDCPLDTFSTVQKALAAKFGTDPAVHDLSRVMRLPGFYHRKGDPYLVRLVHPKQEASA